MVFYQQKTVVENIVVCGVIGTIIYLMSINMSNAISNGVPEELQHDMLYSGIIRDTLKNDNDNSTWLLSGSWKSNLFADAEFNYTYPAKFSAKINMVMENGSLSHKHKISHFKLTNVSTDGLSKVYEGLAAVSMELGPVFAVPIKIMNFQNGTISISLESVDDITLDQAKVVNHFEGKPILGIMGNKIN